MLAYLACGLATSNSAVSELECKPFSFGTKWLKSPVPPVNLLALLFNRISLIPQTSTDRLPLVELWGILPVESRKNRHIFRGIIWWNYLVESTEFFRPPACPPAATPPRVPPRALGSGHPAPHRGAPFAARSPCFVAAGQRTENG